MAEIQRQKERILEAEKKRGKLTKAKFTNDLKNNQQEIESLEDEINDLYIKLKEETQKVELAYNEYNKIVSELESKKTKLRELKLIKPKRISLSSSQEKKYAYYQESFNRVYAVTSSCDSLIGETRKRFDIQNLKLEYIKRYESNVREISGLVNSYKKRFSEFADKFDNDFKSEQISYVNAFKQEMQNTDIESLNTKEDLDHAISILTRLAEETKDQIEGKFAPFISHLEGLTFEIDDHYCPLKMDGVKN